jgi:hypothetical protein
MIGCFEGLSQSLRQNLPVNAMHPTASDFFRAETIRNIIDGVPDTTPFTQEHLAPVHKDFDKLIRDWREEIANKLLDLLSPGLSDFKM